MIEIDFEKTDFDKSVELNVHGWMPLTVNYYTKVKSNVSWVFWKITGTEHVFQIQYQTILLRHGGNLQEHFSLTLETFRKDYKDWEKENFSEDWMKRYQKMFHTLIK